MKAWFLKGLPESLRLESDECEETEGELGSQLSLSDVGMTMLELERRLTFFFFFLCFSFLSRFFDFLSTGSGEEDKELPGVRSRSRDDYLRNSSMSFYTVKLSLTLIL